MSAAVSNRRARPNLPQLCSFMQAIEQKNDRAAMFMRQRGFDVSTHHGQRISVNRAACALDASNNHTLNGYGQAQQHQRTEDRDYTEIFIGKIPRDLFEDELLPHLLEVGGTVVMIRYMMDFSKATRGYCFVKFATTAEATRACKILDGRVLRRGCPPIGTKISFDNRCLFFGNLPPRCTADQLIRALRKVEIAGIVEARMAETGSSRGNSPPFCYPGSPNEARCARNRSTSAAPASRFGYVYFESHNAATAARRMLLPGQIKILGRKITLDWAKSEIPSEVTEQLKNPLVNSILSPKQQLAIQRQHQMDIHNKHQMAMILSQHNNHHNYNHQHHYMAPNNYASFYEQNMRALRSIMPSPAMEPEYFTHWKNPVGMCRT